MIGACVACMALVVYASCHVPAYFRLLHQQQSLMLPREASTPTIVVTVSGSTSATAISWPTASGSRRNRATDGIDVDEFPKELPLPSYEEFVWMERQKKLEANEKKERKQRET